MLPACLWRCAGMGSGARLGGGVGGGRRGAAGGRGRGRSGGAGVGGDAAGGGGSAWGDCSAGCPGCRCLGSRRVRDGDLGGRARVDDAVHTLRGLSRASCHTHCAVVVVVDVRGAAGPRAVSLGMWPSRCRRCGARLLVLVVGAVLGPLPRGSPPPRAGALPVFSFFLFRSPHAFLLTPGARVWIAGLPELSAAQLLGFVAQAEPEIGAPRQHFKIWARSTSPFF